MKMKLFLLFAVMLLCSLLLPAAAFAQACTGLQVNYTTAESRCMSTGSITLAVSGGSGNYNYKVQGPINTSFTSSNIITGLQAGTYSVIVRDVNKNCETTIENVTVAGAYQDPRFTLSHTNVSCTRNDGTITVNGQQYGRAPFTYTIVAPSPAQVGTSTTTGSFANLVPGEYAIQQRDSCGGIQVRRITIEDYSWSIDATTVTMVDCNTINVLLRVKDNKGNINTTTPAAFAGFQYGVVNGPGDTTWHATNSFNYSIEDKRFLTFVAKDPCGRVHTRNWSVPDNVRPAITGVNTTIVTCSTFTAAVTGQRNLNSPQYLLYDNNSTVIANNTTGTFANLAYGSYCIDVVDVCYDTVIKKCFEVLAPALGINGPNMSNETCHTFTATFTTSNFTANNFCLYSAQGALLSCNATGVFDGLGYGDYCIKATDACSGNIIEKCFTAAKPRPVITNYSVENFCNSFNLTITSDSRGVTRYCLYDNDLIVIACNETGVFEGLPYGEYCITAAVCGVVSESVCFTSIAPVPAIDAEVAISNKACATFTATITGQTNLTTPMFYLLDGVTKAEIANNTTGIFHNVPYGIYCIKLVDGCNNTTIERCFEVVQPQPTVAATMLQSNITCSTLTATVVSNNLINPQYCLYNAADVLVACNTTGVFDNLPFGTYCVVVTDGCTAQTFRVCQTFALDFNITLTTAKTCALGEGTVTATFANGFAPYTVNVYNPNGELRETKNTSAASTTFTLPMVAAGQLYTITATDNCGRTATQTIAPDATVITKSISVVSKCPSSAWQNGSGNLVVSSSSNFRSVTPKIILKNGGNWPKGYSSSSGSTYTFSDLEPATYIVEYSLRDCAVKLYDTVTIRPYTYPSQGQSAIYQCDNNSFSLSADVTGGLGPYNYQIIGSDPESPSIVTAEQSSPVFNINTGTVYSLIRLRTIDGCGNATLNDVSVLPLQNIIIQASADCFFKEVILSVDDIPNATYQWYKKTGTDDSTLLTTDKTYNLPFMQPEDVGTYVCKVTVSGGCITRVSRYTLDGDCGHNFLANALQLAGKTTTGGNALSWPVADATVVAYSIERRGAHDTGFTAIAIVKATTGNNRNGYTYTDAAAVAATNQYRVKWITGAGKWGYSNIVSLKGKNMPAVVYPNPVSTQMNIAFSGMVPATYRIQLHNAAGQAVYKTELKNITNTLFRYNRSAQLGAGLYLLKITDVNTGEAVHYKVLFK